MYYEYFTTAQIAEAAGFTIKQINYWNEQGILTPSIQQANGSGSVKLYGIDNLTELRFIKKLKDEKVSTQKIRKVINILREVMSDPDPLRRAILISHRGTILALCKTKEGERVMLDGLIPGGQQVMPIVLEMLVQEALEIAERIEATVIVSKEEVSV
jgi:DNA-binding transcriptional MerR regulator